MTTVLTFIRKPGGSHFSVTRGNEIFDSMKQRRDVAFGLGVGDKFVGEGPEGIYQRVKCFGVRI